MSVLLAFVLSIFHLIYAIVLRVRSLRKQLFAPLPQPLQAPRRRIPQHLAIVFATDPSISLDAARDALTENVVNAVEWCRTIGIKKLTVYEEKDMLFKCTQAIRERLPVQAHDVDSSESETDYPLTPPPSDHSDSRPLSPSDTPGGHIPVTKIHIAEPRSPRKESQNFQKPMKRRQQQKSTKSNPSTSSTKSDLLLCLISSEASKPAIAATTRALARAESRRLRSNPSPQKGSTYKLSVDELDQMLEDESGLSSPDFMIIHPIDSTYSSPAPPELHGFPPWHIRLTEIYQNHPRDQRALPFSIFNWKITHTPVPLDEISFREALDEYASAEMRFGK